MSPLTSAPLPSKGTPRAFLTHSSSSCCPPLQNEGRPLPLLGKGDRCDALRGPTRAGEKGRRACERESEQAGRNPQPQPRRWRWARPREPPLRRGFDGPAQLFPPPPSPRVTHNLSSSPLGAAAIFFAARNPRGGEGGPNQTGEETRRVRPRPLAPYWTLPAVTQDASEALLANALLHRRGRLAPGGR